MRMITVAINVMSNSKKMSRTESTVVGNTLKIKRSKRSMRSKEKLVEFHGIPSEKMNEIFRKFTCEINIQS